jgi:hypothetical protein
MNDILEICRKALEEAGYTTWDSLRDTDSVELGVIGAEAVRSYAVVVALME